MKRADLVRLLFGLAAAAAPEPSLGFVVVGPNGGSPRRASGRPSLVVRPRGPPSLSATATAATGLDSMTVAQLKALIKESNPPRGALTKLKKKADLIRYLERNVGVGVAAATDEEKEEVNAPDESRAEGEGEGAGTSEEDASTPPAAASAAVASGDSSSSSSAPVVRVQGEVEWQTRRGTFSFPGITVDPEGGRSSSVGGASFDRQIATTFPGALTNAQLMNAIEKTLTKEVPGYDRTKTLVATSLCCDEVNRPLESALSDVFNTNFNMGGLAGFPFGGKTSYGAMAAHIPDGGSCLVVYGPHVGVDSNGKVGTVERRGKTSGGACCGSAVAAAGYVASVLNGEADQGKGTPATALDAQQYFVGSMLLPHAERLENAGDNEEDKMRELPYALYDAQTELMTQIVTESPGAVAGDSGTTAVLGGIQINTPPGYSDYYLPLSFDLYDSKGEVVKDLLPSTGVSRRPFPAVTSIFPGALPNGDLVRMVTTTLKERGYDPSTNSLVATSLCCDEVNRPLETDFANVFDANFNMGGLAGFPFGGATSFGAMAAHIPDGGSCLVVFGPHVGVDSEGNVGTVERRGKTSGGACCGSAVAACGYVTSVFNGEAEEASPPPTALDAQQYYVGSMLLPYAERLAYSDEKMVELPYALYDAQAELMEQIVEKAGGAVGEDGTTAVLGGIQINTPPGYSDYYLPLSFQLYDGDGKFVEDLWE